MTTATFKAAQLLCILFSPLIYLTLLAPNERSILQPAQAQQQTQAQQQQQQQLQLHRPSHSLASLGLINNQDSNQANSHSYKLSSSPFNNNSQRPHRQHTQQTTRQTTTSAVTNRNQQQQQQHDTTTSSQQNSNDQQQQQQGLLVCPDGWQRHSSQCYKFFQQRHSWERAKDICEKYGAQLALIHDYQQNNFTSQLADAQLLVGSSPVGASPDSGATSKQQQQPVQALFSSDERSYWIGFRTIDRLETNTLESAANTFVSKYIGFWDYEEPRVSQGECVRATVRRESGASQATSYKLIASQSGFTPATGQQQQQQVWQLAQCEDLLPFVCQRQVCSSNSFHCSNGRCVNAAWKCDGHNDCGDDSDEMDCPNRCHYYMSSSGDKVQSINYPQRYEPNSDCKWTLEGPLEAGMLLQFYEFDTEKNFDQVQVLAGARTEDRAYSLASLSGQLNLTNRPFISGSNLMIVKFKSDSNTEKRGFRASWKTEPIECGGELFAHNSAQLITSPLYPDQYPGSIECVYRLIAPAGKLISLELIELDLAPERDFLFVRDGQQAADPLLGSLTGSLRQNLDKKFLISSANKLYLYFRSQPSAYQEQRRGFAVRFRTECDINYVAAHGIVSSPGFQVGRYPLNQQCVYRIGRPDQQLAAAGSNSSTGSLTIRLDRLDVAADDQLIAYDGHDLQTATRIQPQQSANPKQPQDNKERGRLAAKQLLTAQSGKLTLVFSTAALPGSGQSVSARHRGFSATFSADCAPLKLGRNVIVAPSLEAASTSAKFGQELAYSCPRGQEFQSGQLRLVNRCQLGGKWAMSKVPHCQERYCGPVPQIDNGFAIQATGVTFNQTATYKCYNGFKLASGRQTETIACLESGSWGKLPECYSTSCPPLREVPNARQLVLSGSELTRSYGTVIRFECEPGYQRIGAPSILCTSSGQWSAPAPDCQRAQCHQVPAIEHGYLVELDPKLGQQPINTQQRRFLFQDEARIQCYKGYRLEAPANNSSQGAGAKGPGSIQSGIIRCGASQSFENVPRCVDIDECQQPASCDSASTQCRNSQGAYHCDCKPGYAANLDCKPAGELGLSSGQLPDSAIRVSSTAPNFDKANIRMSRQGWCGNFGGRPTSEWVRIDLQTISIIRGFRIQPVMLSPPPPPPPPPSTADGSGRGVGQQQQQAYPSLLRLRYSNNLTDEFRDYQDATKRAIQFRLNNLNNAGIFNVQLPLPVEARHLELMIVEYHEGPCMKLELTGCLRQSCSDINECLDNNGGCSSKCLNSPGSYQCACERGFDLFEADGQHGFFVAAGETGKRDGDLYRLNKTCVPKQCPTLSDPPNGQLLSTRSLFHFGDTVRFKCNFGFVMSAPQSATLGCGPNGQWNGTVPECHQAKCKPLSNDRAQGLVAKFEDATQAGATLAPSQQQQPPPAPPQDLMASDSTTLSNGSDGQLAFLSNMTVQCKEPGRQLRPTASAKFRQCVYNIRNDTGRGDYWFSGTSPACPRVDCGTPTPTAGALPYQYSDTRFGSSFFFGCEDSYNLAGSSTRSGNVVTCRADATWDFGDLRCEGPVCQDPGHAPDGEQTATTSFEPASQVQFRCKRPGFVPYSAEPLVCARGADCKVIRPLGLASGLIPDKSINASSYRDNYEPWKARLGSSTGWCGKISETMPYISVDLGRAHKVKAILLKGVVTVDVVGRPLEVRVFYKRPGQSDMSLVYPNFNLTSPIDLLQQQLGLANYGELTMLQLPSAVVASQIGINIVRSIRNPCLRFEVLGCEMEPTQQQQQQQQPQQQLGYDQPAPVCVDQEPPQFSACPDQPVAVQRGPYGELLPVNFTVPQAYDNSGLVSRVEVRPKGFRPGQYVFHDLQVHYIASDNDGNVAICTVNITVPDVTAPRLACPPSHTHYLELPPMGATNSDLTGGNSNNNADQQAGPSQQVFDYNQLMRDKIRASDESGPVYLELVPSSGSVPVNSFENVTVYARDKYNNTAQCNFQVRVRAPTCSQYSLQAPNNGRIECLPRSEPETGGMSAHLFQCVATCNEGYRFLDGRRAHTYDCDNRQPLAPQVQDCVTSQVEDSSYNVLATINYRLQAQPSGSAAPLSTEQLIDCMSNYTEFVKQYARDLQEVLSSRCKVLDDDTRIEFKSIRSFLRPGSARAKPQQQQHDELVAIQYDLQIDSKEHKNPLFEHCGKTIMHTFDLRLPAKSAIGPLLNMSLSAASFAGTQQAGASTEGAELSQLQQMLQQMNCPALIASSSSSSAGYKCAPGLILTNQTILNPQTGNLVSDSLSASELAAGSFGQDRLADMEVPVCLQCPLGTFSAEGGEQATSSQSRAGASSQCKLCPRGFYQDQSSQSDCKQCPEGTHTLAEGSKSLADCQPVCAHGHYSATGLAPCDQCPANAYSGAPQPIAAGSTGLAGYTDCAKCPAHKPFTYAPGASGPGECRAKCQPGTYSDTGLEPCSLCPVNFYQEREGATRCDECAMSNRTLKMGSTAPDQCQPSSCMPTLNPATNGPCLPDSDEAQTGRCFAGCQQNGVCQIQLHEPQCHCPAGFRGKYCEIEINECASQPCYNGGQCQDLKQGYRCKCQPGYSGLQCQLEQSDCRNDTCPERSMCQDLPGINNFTCLCRAGYTGPNCNITVNPCESVPAVCENGAQCVPLQQGRHKCLCPAGWTGSRCEINVDDCAEEPCLMGARCTDLVNDYHCECPSGFAGKRCHEKVDQCAGQPCGPNGLCVDRLFSFECLCNPGWRGERCNQTVDACASNPCLNEGECVSTVSAASSLVSARAELLFQLNRQLASSSTPTDDSSPALPSVPQQTGWYNSSSGGSAIARQTRELMAEIAAIEQDHFKCICPPQFAGSRCQHEVDGCETNRCENGGQCIDTSTGFECKCKPGFLGLNCQVMVKECDSEPCFAQGTAECLDLPNAHRCVCLPGYSGERCDLDVDDCASEPCKNGAQCVDKVNDFHCQCAPGWQGKQCDLEVGKCSAQEPCLNNAKCVDLFEDYFCVCPSGTDGKQCQTSPRRCIGEPCQNGGQCNDFGSGLNCSCPARYSGSGCQHLLDPCSEQAQTCKNGATCVDLGQNDYMCQCPVGWTGKNCDQDVPDCGPQSCSPNAQCIDLTNGFYCKCPPDMTGENCRKPIQVDYDLNFNDLTKSSSAGQTIPFELGEQLRALTISFWVQFKTSLYQLGSSSELLGGQQSSLAAAGQPSAALLAAQPLSSAAQSRSADPKRQQQAQGADDQAYGVYLSLYSNESPYELSPRNREQLVRFDHSGVRVSLFPNRTHEYLPFLVNVPINDGQWHYVNLIWDGQSGNLTLITDSAVAATRSNYARSESLSGHYKYAYLNLGAELMQPPASADHQDQQQQQQPIAAAAAAAALANKPKEGSGFYGRMSRVNVWSKALDISSEIPKQFRNCKSAPLIAQQQLLAHWAGYDRIQGNVEREQPGQCGQRVCPIGLTGDECAILQQDKQAPKVLLCPPDMWVITPNVSTAIEWDEPHFIDDLAKPVAVAEQNNLKPGAMFDHGVYDLSYIAVDESGNTARCDFQIRVLRDFCPVPLAPLNGRAHCKAWGPNGRFRACSIECQDGFEFSQPVSQYYVCGAEGFWRPTSDPQRDLVFPACTPKHSAQRIYRMSVNFPSAAICSESGKRILNSRIYENLLKIDQNWKLCSQSEERGKCEHLRVNVKCNKQQQVASSGSAGLGSSLLHEQRSPLLSSSSSSSSSSPSLSRLRRWAPQTTLNPPLMTTIASLSGQQQQQQQQDGSSRPQEDVYTVEVSFPANADPIISTNTNKLKRNITDILREAIFKESILDVHQTLPSVQPDISSLELRNDYACEPGTVVVGSSCVECAPGTYYDDPSRACQECPAGSYQDETRATQCKLCPTIGPKVGVTATTGARSSEQCKERCPAGKYYDDQVGLCRSCGYGYYQPLEGSFACLACGPGMTTRSMEPISRHECRPECEPGQQLSQLGSCEPCPAGSYRARGRPACEQCPAGFTTETAASTERRQCNLILCSAGQYLNVTTDKCQECPRGHYQPREQRDTQCLSCPSDTTTDLEGATSQDNCTNPCFINGQAQMCQPNSYCVFSRETQNYTCECKPKYRMDDNEQCVYVCDDYCLNGGSCSANSENNRPRCDCLSSFYGERCERKSEFIYIASGIGIGLAMILFIILVIWMICVRTSSSSSSSMSHIAAHHPTKQALQSLHASQLDFAALAAAAAAVGGAPNGGGSTMPSGGHQLSGHPNGGAFYYGAGANGYAESIAPSHHSAYAHYYDDEEDVNENAWDMPNFYNETFLKDQQQQQHNNYPQKSKQNLYSTSSGQQQLQQEHLIDPQLLADQPVDHHNHNHNHNHHHHHQSSVQQPQQQQQVPQNGIGNKDELYDRLKRHLYTGQKGDTTDSGEDAQ